MTAHRGARAGGASRAHANAEASDIEDRDGADPELRSMRAVWLTMREEDPPAGGMSELLAAARAKAETMQPIPSPWQRLVAALRRPPALALVTVMVMVLAGGAVLVGRHDDRMEVQRGVPRSAPDSADDGAVPHRPTAPRASVSEDERRLQRRGDGSETLAAGDEPVLGARPPVTTRGAGPPESLRKPPRAPGATWRDDQPAPPALQERAGPSNALSKPDEAKQRGARAETTTTVAPARPANSLRGSLAQLYRQCEVAAQRGDCPGVKRIVERITTTDRDYRARLAGDSPIARCLAD